MPAAIREGSNSPLIVIKVQGGGGLVITTFSVVFITILLDKMNYTEIIGVYFSAYSLYLYIANISMIILFTHGTIQRKK